jgi:hypothetical protein
MRLALFLAENERAFSSGVRFCGLASSRTFPFVDHSTATQNVLYGFAVAAPFYIIIIIFMLVTRGDLSSSAENE